jgi:hypothetical protein
LQSADKFRTRFNPWPADLDQTPEQEEFDYYARLRNAGLLEVPDDPSLYWACMNGGTVRLTSLGRYYWELARDGLLARDLR